MKGAGWAELRERTQAATERFVAGDPSGYKALWSQASDVMIMGAYGGYERGWAEVDPRLSWAAAQPGPKGFAFETLGEFVADTLGCRVGIQRYDNGQALRVTELFRRDESRWRLVHRHADWLQPKGAAAVMR